MGTTPDKPIPLYVENFLGFDVGRTVPIGYYDFEKAVWVASDSGRVVEVLDVSSGVAALDVDGDGSADSGPELEQLGITSEERIQVAGTFSAGTTLWRVTVRHFTPFDINWAWLLSEDAQPPQEEPTRIANNVDDPCKEAGSIISCENQTLGETIPVSGSGMALNYHSSRSIGFTADRRIFIPLTRDELPPGLRWVRVRVEIAGQRHLFEFRPAANLSHVFEWDGLDAYDRRVQGRVQARIVTSYVYPREYRDTRRFGDGGFEGTGIAERVGSETELSKETILTLGDLKSVPSNSLGGWTPSGHSTLDPSSGLIYHADGRVQHSAAPRATTIIDASTIGIYFANTILPDGQGGFFTAGTSLSGVVWHVDRGGNHVVVAGHPVLTGFRGDGGPATEALLAYIGGLAVVIPNVLPLKCASAAMVTDARCQWCFGLTTTA